MERALQASTSKDRGAGSSSGPSVRREVLETTLAAPGAQPLVPAGVALVPPPRPPPLRVVPPAPAEEADEREERERGEADEGEKGGSVAAAGALPPPSGRAGPRLQRSSLPELFLAMTTPDRGEDGGLIVDDDTDTLTTGQRRKSEFLRELRTEVRRVAEQELSRVGRSAEGCPYIEEMLRRYEGRTAAQVERSVRRYAPEARYVRDAFHYLPYVSARLSRGIARWAETGEMPDDAPSDELQAFSRAGGWVGVAAGLMGMRAAPPPPPYQPGDERRREGRQQPRRKALGESVGIGPDAAGGQGTALGRVDATALVPRLGPGRPLDGTTRARMEGALGHSFADVRIHADERAAELSRDLSARAFTLGPHIAYGAGEPAPGTPEGDALLAHELAHVVQQGGGEPVGEIPVGAPGDDYEREADAAATRALASLYGERAPDDEALRATPLSGGGLRLQRCGSNRSSASRVPTPPPQAQVAPNYRAALAGLATSAADIHAVLSAAPLDGGMTRVRTDRMRVDGGGQIEMRFELDVGVRPTSDPAVVAEFVSPTSDQDLQMAPDNSFLLARMRMNISPAAAVDTPAHLERTLFHEGIHMMVFMDKLLQGSPLESRFGPGLTTYMDLVNAHADTPDLRGRISAVLLAHGAPNDRLDRLSNEVIEHVVEEKFAYDQEISQYGGNRPSNTLIASAHLDLMLTAPSAPFPGTMSATDRQQMIAVFVRILDAIDASRPAALPTAAPAPAPAQAPPQP